MALVLRSEKGSPLLASEIDGNFTFLQGLIDALNAGVTAEGIASVSIDADGISFVGTLGTVWGPIAIPVAIRAKGVWVTGQVYARNDLVQNGSDLYLVSATHTSSVFDDDVSTGNLAKAYTGPNAAAVAYDHTTSGLSAADTQAALDEVVARVAALEAA